MTRAPRPGAGLAWLGLLVATAVAVISPALGQDDGAATAPPGDERAAGTLPSPGETGASGASGAPEAGTSGTPAPAEGVATPPEAPPVAEPAALTAEPAAAPDPDAPDAAALEAADALMRGAHLGELAMRTRETLQHLRPLLRTTDDVGDIDRRLPSIELEIERLSDPEHRARIALVSQRELADLGQEWRRHQTTFESWRATLAARVEELRAVQAELVELKSTWTALFSASNTLGRPESRHARIADSLLMVRDAAAALNERHNHVADLEDRVSELVIVTEDVRDEIGVAAAAFRERLLVRDRLPLWSGLGPPVGSAAPGAGSDDESAGDASPGGTATAPGSDAPPDATGTAAPDGAEGEPSTGTDPPPPTLAARVEAQLDMVAQQLSKATRLGLLFLALALALVLLRRRSAAWASDEALSVPRAIVARPISVALLATLFVAPFSLTHAPILFYDLHAIVLLGPLARVLPPLAPARARPLVYVLVAFLLVSRIEGMADDLSDARRVLLLVECTAVALAALAWARTAWSDADRTLGWLVWLSAAVAAVLSVALVANVLGWVFLATILARGAAFSVQTGLTLVASVEVVVGLFDLAIRSQLGLRLRGLKEHGALVRHHVLRGLSLGALVFWVVATLSGFGVWEPVSEWLEGALAREWEVGSLVLSLGRFGTAIVILVLTTWLSRLVRFVLELDVLPRLALEPGVDGAVSGLTRYVIVGVGILLALAALGIDAAQLALVAGALGVGVGFGLQGIVANFIAGLVLMLERPVRLGDLIQVGTLTGTVERIGLRSSTVRATDGSEVIVPNEGLISREVVNWTLSDRKRRVQLTVGVAYGTNPTLALEVIRGAVAGQAGVLGKAAGGGPEPTITFDAFGASSLDFVIRFWTADLGQADTLKSLVGIAVHDALGAAGIEIPFPQQDVRIVGMPAGAPKVEARPTATESE